MNFYFMIFLILVSFIFHSPCDYPNESNLQVFLNIYKFWQEFFSCLNIIKVIFSNVFAKELKKDQVFNTRET